MLQPIPFHARRQLPDHLLPPPARPPEADADRRARNFDVLRELTDLNMLAARDAAHRIAERDPKADPAATPATADPTLALARATRAVVTVLNLESRLAAGERPAPVADDDPRGLALRELLFPLLAREPDPVRRRALRGRVADRIVDALGADLDDDLPLAEIALVIANEFGLPLDLAKIPDEYLDPPPRPHSPLRPARPEADARDQR